MKGRNQIELSRGLRGGEGDNGRRYGGKEAGGGYGEGDKGRRSRELDTKVREEERGKGADE